MVEVLIMMLEARNFAADVSSPSQSDPRGFEGFGQAELQPSSSHTHMNFSPCCRQPSGPAFSTGSQSKSSSFFGRPTLGCIFFDSGNPSMRNPSLSRLEMGSGPLTPSLLP